MQITSIDWNVKEVGCDYDEFISLLIAMGQVLSKEEDEVGLQDTVEYEQLMTEQFGPITIFRQDKKPYRYYLRHRETAIEDAKTYQRLKAKEQWYKQLPEHKNMVGLELVSLRKSKCIISQSMICVSRR